MIRLVTDSFGWIADASGERLTLRTNRAREIAETADKDKRYRVEIKEYRPRRSLDQNAMYWSILGQVAKALNISNSKAHNLMLRRYGQPERYGDQSVFVVLPDTEQAAEQAYEAETYHVKPTSQTKVGKDGNVYRTYLLLRGSSTYDTAEMTRLIDGLMDEARQMGIESEWRYDE